MRSWALLVAVRPALGASLAPADWLNMAMDAAEDVVGRGVAPGTVIALPLADDSAAAAGGTVLPD